MYRRQFHSFALGTCLGWNYLKRGRLAHARGSQGFDRMGGWTGKQFALTPLH